LPHGVAAKDRARLARCPNRIAAGRDANIQGPRAGDWGGELGRPTRAAGLGILRPRALTQARHGAAEVPAWRDRLLEKLPEMALAEAVLADVTLGRMCLSLAKPAWAASERGQGGAATG
jgi:hypothetical protein